MILMLVCLFCSNTGHYEEWWNTITTPDMYSTFSTNVTTDLEGNLQNLIWKAILSNLTQFMVKNTHKLIKFI